MTSARTVGERVPSMLSVVGLSKSFGATQALRDVSFAVEPGRVLAVVGENGAGKSTLVKTLAGVIRPDGGTITLGDRSVAFHSPRDALRQGVVLIPQELAYAPELSVAENITMGMLPSRMGIVSQRRIRATAKHFLDQVAPDLSLDTSVARLTLAEQQLVEIAKALSRRARVLLLDEPTAALSDAESARLFGVMAALRRQAVPMIYISHRLDDLAGQVDDLLVLRDGRAVARGPIDVFSKTDMIAAMIGDQSIQPGLSSNGAAAPSLPADTTTAAPIVEFVGVGHRESGGLKDLNLKIHRGQIVGVFGLRGGGQDAAVECLAGLRPHASGELRVGGRIVARIKSTRDARRYGIFYVPADRKRQGLVMTANVRTNLSLPQISRIARFGVVSRATEKRMLVDMARRLQLRYRDGNQLVGELSGGNQQKVLIGSRLVSNPDVLLLHEPSRGVDVGARHHIHELIRDLARSGAAILLATTDVEEAVDLTSVLHVLSAGRVVSTLEGTEKTRENALGAAG